MEKSLTMSQGKYTTEIRYDYYAIDKLKIFQKAPTINIDNRIYMSQEEAIELRNFLNEVLPK